VDFQGFDYEGIVGMSVDRAGNVYIGTSNDVFDVGPLVYKVPAGTVSSSVPDLPIAVPFSAVSNDSIGLTSSVADCHNNIYMYSGSSGELYRYSPGASVASFVGRGVGTNTTCFLSGGFGDLRLDKAGNLFFLDGSAVKEIVAGTAAPMVAVPGSCVEDDNHLVSDFWIDANDTIYLTVFNASNNTGAVEKWSPGASTGQRLLNFSAPNDESGFIPIHMDVRGNIYIFYGQVPDLSEFKRSTSIDSAFTPTDTGAYYAVATDIQGYTTTSDTFHVNAPSAGPPSIQISATATSSPVCTPITFTAEATNAGANPFLQWQVSGVPAGGDSTTYSYNLFANGDRVYCVLTAQAGCNGPVSDTSNIITLSIDPHGAASVTISTPKDTVCDGSPEVFTATVMNGAAQPIYQWMLNCVSTGDVTDTFSRSNFTTGDVVTCLIISDDACGLAKSNSIPLAIDFPPVIAPGQVFTIPYGQSLTLNPAVSGAATSWIWSPATGLSDPSIEDPVADPPATMLYTLIATDNRCADTATILINVYTPLSIPNAFTPNGDGRNDIFYVLGGPVNSRVAEFAVFNREGAEVFHVHGVAPGDPNFGWNGSFHGSPAPAGAYVYMVELQLANNRRQIYKGTVVLIR
jgi:gliding motility-associated-like protein